MANALAIAGVTATLQYFLNLVYNHPNSALGGVTVSSVSPDLVQGTAGGANAGLHVNVFLHQVTHNASWRNVGFPSLGSDGATPLHNPPLALDLHYLLTAYGSEDTQAEALLGYAVLMLHENPTLPRAQIRAALGNLPTTNPLASVLGSSGLADQLEMIKITPSTLGREEMAWLWTALKADYRPTYPFQVSVVLIQPGAASSAALPVLSRNVGIQVGPTPELFQVVLPVGRTAVSPGDTVTLTGAGLTGATQVSLTYQTGGQAAASRDSAGRRKRYERELRGSGRCGECAGGGLQRGGVVYRSHGCGAEQHGAGTASAGAGDPGRAGCHSDNERRGNAGEPDLQTAGSSVADRKSALRLEQRCGGRV